MSENSIINSIHLFYVIDNFALDLMHVFFEGVPVYVNINHLITISLKYFLFEFLNFRKQ